MIEEKTPLFTETEIATIFHPVPYLKTLTVKWLSRSHSNFAIRSLFFSE